MRPRAKIVQIHMNKLNKILQQIEALTKRMISRIIKDKIDKNTITAIRSHHSRCAELYKTHKEGEPLRPIVSGIDDPIDRLGWLLEQITTQLLKCVSTSASERYGRLSGQIERSVSKGISCW